MYRAHGEVYRVIAQVRGDIRRGHRDKLHRTRVLEPAVRQLAAQVDLEANRLPIRVERGEWVGLGNEPNSHDAIRAHLVHGIARVDRIGQ